jgi:hypothetical protein
MFIMLLKPLRSQLIIPRRKYRLSKPFYAQLAHQRQTRGCEQHLLAHGSGIGDVCDGDEGRGGVGWIAAEDYVDGGFGLEMGR